MVVEPSRAPLAASTMLWVFEDVSWANMAEKLVIIFLELLLCQLHVPLFPHSAVSWIRLSSDYSIVQNNPIHKEVDDAISSELTHLLRFCHFEPDSNSYEHVYEYIESKYYPGYQLMQWKWSLESMYLLFVQYYGFFILRYFQHIVDTFDPTIFKRVIYKTIR